MYHCVVVLHLCMYYARLLLVSLCIHVFQKQEHRLSAVCYQGYYFLFFHQQFFFKCFQLWSFQ